MPQTRHTPGPWEVGHMNDRRADIGTSDPMSTPIVTVWVNGHTDDANVALVRAAPDLYEALETMLDDCSMSASEGAQSVARAALAKARG